MSMDPKGILKEFAKGCTNGAAGECEECLNGTVSALEHYFRKEKILIEHRERVGPIEIIERIYQE